MAMLALVESDNEIFHEVLDDAIEAHGAVMDRFRAPSPLGLTP